MRGKKEREAATRVVKEKAEFFPEPAVEGNDAGEEVEDQAQQAREAGVADDNEEGAEEQGEYGELKGNHAVRR